jgi:hypothetical protein
MIAVRPADGTSERRPDDVIEVAAEWDLAKPPQRLEARLFWYTQGSGSPDIGVVQTTPVAMADQRGKERFRFKLPAGPYSCSGQLVSIGWAVELTGDDDLARWDFTLGPEGKAVMLERPNVVTRLQ